MKITKKQFINSLKITTLSAISAMAFTPTPMEAKPQIEARLFMEEESLVASMPMSFYNMTLGLDLYESVSISGILESMPEPEKAPLKIEVKTEKKKKKASLAQTTAKKNRLSHARELLGKHYNHSVVKYGEKVKDIHDFIYQQVKTELSTQPKKQQRKVAQAIIKESRKYHFDPVFLVAFIENESSFNTNAVGTSGEIGLMQILPDTAEWISKKYNLPWKGAKSLKNPEVNIRIGTAYLDYLRAKFDSHSQLYIAAYNMGATNVHRALDKEVWPKDYPIRVMQRYIRMYSEMRDSSKRTTASDS